MRKLITYGVTLAAVLLLLPRFASAQVQVANDLQARNSLTIGSKKITAISSDTTAASKSGSKLITEEAAKKYTDLIVGGSAELVPGGATTTNITVGTNPGSNLTATAWINATFYGRQPPIATLTGGGIYEFTSASTVGRTLSWSASRQSATNTLSSIVVGGTSQSFSQPAQPGTVSGTQAVTVTTNTSTTYYNVTTATGSLSATASTTFEYQSKYYRGYTTTATPTDADILAATGETVGGSFATSRAVSATLPDPPASRYIVFAFPASFGTATIKINGLAVGYTLTTRSLANASGYSVSYNIYVSPFATAGGVDYQIL